MENLLHPVLDAVPIGPAAQAELVRWAEAILASAGAHPRFAAALLSLALVAALAGRSLSLLAMGLALSLGGVWLVGRPGPDAAPAGPQLLALVQMMLLLACAWGWRRRMGRLRRHMTALQAERAELRFRLDREILWRTAAQPSSLAAQEIEAPAGPPGGRATAPRAAFGLAAAGS